LRIIFTQEDKKLARKQIDGFRQSYVIDVREMVLEYDYQPDSRISTPQDFIIQQEIEKKLRQAMNNKKSKQVIYFHYKLSPYLVNNVREFFAAHGAKFEFALFDSSDALCKMHDCFDVVVR
jgi:predicted kinase